MPEMLKEEIKDKDLQTQKPDSTEEASRQKEEQEGSYYYDDACGYEIYEPGDDEESE